MEASSPVLELYGAGCELSSRLPIADCRDSLQRVETGSLPCPSVRSSLCGSTMSLPSRGNALSSICDAAGRRWQARAPVFRDKGGGSLLHAQ